MKKQLKKILFVTDDFGNHAWKIRKELTEPGNVYYGRKSNWLKFKFDKVKSFDKIDHRKKYDAVLIDYGLIGDKKDNITFLQKLYAKDIPLAWVGGLGGCGRYNEDAKKMFPRHRFIHNLPSSTTGHEDMLFLLYDIFNKKVCKCPRECK